MSWLPLKSHIIHSKLLLDNSASITSSRMEDLCQKLEGKTNFSRHLKQLMAWPDWLLTPHIFVPAPLGGGIKLWCCLTSDVCLSVCLSVGYIRPKSRTERPRKTKIGTEVGHVTRDSDTNYKVKRSKVTGGGGVLWRPPAQLVYDRSTPLL